MIVNGREEVSPVPSPEAAAQLMLRYRLACSTAAEYARAEFSVVYQDVLLGPHLTQVVGALSCHRAAVVMLNPRLDVIAGRDRALSKTAYSTVWTPETLVDGLRETPRIGLWLDTSELTVAQTVD